jgi:hypothetical protein
MKHTRTYSHHENRSHTSNLFALLSGAVLAAVLVCAGCANPASPTGLSGGSWSVTQDGGADGTTDTASLFFMFGEDPGDLAAEEISLGGADTDTGLAVKGALSGTGKNRRLAVSVAAQGIVTVSINRAGVEGGQKSVTVYKQGAHDGITWTVEARGQVDTGPYPYPLNALVFTFSAPVENLTANEIVINGGSLDHVFRKGAPEANADKTVWTMPITWWFSSLNYSEPSVQITKEGLRGSYGIFSSYVIGPNVFTVAAEAGGVYGTTSTPALIVTFARPLRADLKPEDIEISPSENAAAVVGTGITTTDGERKVWRVPLQSVTGNGIVHVWAWVESCGIPPAPNSVLGVPRPTVSVVSAQQDATFAVAAANGATGSANTTALTLTFDRAVPVLPEVRITADTGSATANNAGAATTDSGTTWTLPITTAVEGAVNVSIAPTVGIVKTPVSVTVFKKRSIKIANGSTELDDHLATLGTGSAGSPSTVTLHSSVNLSTDWALVNSMVLTRQKYITLDLSACATFYNPVSYPVIDDFGFTDNDIIQGSTIAGAAGGSDPTGNDFNIIKNNQYIVGIKLPAGLVSVGAYAFYQCAHITSVDFSACLSTLTFIATRAFSGSGLAGPLDLGSTNITTLRYGAYSGCLGITGLVLPTALTKMDGAQIFDGCSNLTGSVSIPAGLTGSSPVSLQSFRNTRVSEVVWPAALTATGSAMNVFQNCPLVKITMQGSMTNVGSNFFKTHSEASNAFKNVYAAGKAEGAQGVAGVYERTIDPVTAWVRTGTL